VQDGVPQQQAQVLLRVLVRPLVCRVPEAAALQQGLLLVMPLKRLLKSKT
jgi:hypothetical protein